MLESESQQEIQKEAAKFGLVLMRNNSGSLKDETGRPVRYGLGNVSKEQNDRIKSSDLIGCLPVTITQDMVGHTIGVFVAVECKREGWKFKGDKRETAQKNFIEFILNKGGIAFFAESVDTFKKELKKYLK